ncbi:MAG TPA: SCO family protein [Flavisolibacter sp.]|nr:SCO family protein [Flavisolibacter sp.]
MNKKAVYGILLVLIVPVTAYFVLKGFTDRDVVLPRHFIPDSTVTVTKDGKQYTDTIWHTIADFNLQNHLGQQVSWDDMEGKVVVASFFFTHCPTICPTLMTNMNALQSGIKSSERVGNREAKFLQFLSFTVDPERDSVAQLKKWADRFQVNPHNWWLLTGDKKEIYDLAIKEMKVPAEDGGAVDSNFMHTDVFVLIDKYRNIRGYYHTVVPDLERGGYTADTASLNRLAQDIIFLAYERDPNKKFFLAGKLGLIAVVFVLAAIGILLLMKIIKKEKK